VCIVSLLVENGKLPDGELKITALRAATPPGAKTLSDPAYDPLPRIKITDLLLEVDRCTTIVELDPEELRLIVDALDDKGNTEFSPGFSWSL